MPQAERLRRASAFQRAYQERRVISSPQLSLYVIPRQGASGRQTGDWRPLTGFVVSKKVSKSACKRNRLKRQVREAYRHLREQVYSGRKGHYRLNQWYVLVFTIHSQALSSTYDQIARAVESCLIRADKRFGNSPVDKETVKKRPKDDHDVNRRASLPREMDNGQV
ncbi:MAG: ribonuclease P protein component [Candidatus Melainabacteria bacterium]|nr:ribonuclease P protein component [Candidatus Melainabacteria bacterium]